MGKKIKLTESQARAAVNKWLFEWIPTNDDKRAGTLGSEDDDRDAKSLIPEPSPIVAMDQMSNPSTVEVPPIEDSEWIPATSDEVARAAHQFSKMVPADEIEWYYNELVKTVDKAVERGNKQKINDQLPEEENIKTMIKAKKGPMPNKVEEAYKNRLMSLLFEGLDDDDLEDPDEENLTPEQWAAFHDEQMADAEGIYGEEFKSEYSLQDLLDTGMFTFKTESMMAKWIKTHIEPHIYIWEVARPLSKQLTQFVQSDAAMKIFYDGLMASKNFTDENVAKLKGIWQLYQGIVQCMQKHKQRIPAKLLKQCVEDNLVIQRKVMEFQAEEVTVADEEGELGLWTMEELWDDFLEFKREYKQDIKDSGLYAEVMSVTVVEPILKRWEKEFGDRQLSRSDKNLVTWEEAGKWLQEEVLDRWFGGTERFPKPRAVGRRAGDIDKALRQRGEYAYDEQGNPVNIWEK